MTRQVFCGALMGAVLVTRTVTLGECWAKKEQDNPCPLTAWFHGTQCSYDHGSIPWIVRAWTGTSGRDSFVTVEEQCVYECKYPNGQVEYEGACAGYVTSGNPCTGTSTGT